MGTFVIYKEKEVLSILLQVLHSEHFIFFATYKRAKYARVFDLSKPFQPNILLHFNLLGHL
jgi:hypothetical protein